MRTFWFALPRWLRSRARADIADKTLEGSQWVRCRTRFKRRQFLLPFVIVGTYFIAWLFESGYADTSWLVALALAAVSSVAYLVGLLTWAISVGRRVILPPRWIPQSNSGNWFVRIRPLSELAYVYVHAGLAQKFGEVPSKKGMFRFLISDPQDHHLVAFAEKLIATEIGISFRRQRRPITNQKSHEGALCSCPVVSLQWPSAQFRRQFSHCGASTFVCTTLLQSIIRLPDTDHTWPTRGTICSDSPLKHLYNCCTTTTSRSLTITTGAGT